MFMSESGCDQMIAELEAAQGLFRRADELLSTTVKPMRERYGFTDKRLEDVAREYAKKVGADH